MSLYILDFDSVMKPGTNASVYVMKPVRNAYVSVAETGGNQSVLEL